MKHQEVDDDQMALISQYYPDIYTQLVPEPGDQAKPRRRRRKNKAGSGESGGGGAFRKRKLSDDQAHQLELNFGSEHKLESERKDRLAAELGLDPRQVAVWFQNRRARWKNKKLEEEYSKLKAEHDQTVVEKCRLETEVLKLKEELFEAERERQKLMEIRSDGSPSTSSFSMEAAMDPLFAGEYGLMDNVFWVPPEWPVNLYGV